MATRPGGIIVTTSYDGYGRLTGYTRTGDLSQTNVYNGMDDRVAVTSGSTTRRYVFDADGRVMGEYGTSATDVIAEFIWLSPEVGDGSAFGGQDGVGGYAPLAVASGPVATPTLFWVHGNHLGVPQVYTNASGAITAPGAWQLPGFPGQSRTLADLYYNRHRDYDPSTGRYIQADPIGLAGDTNPYVYAGANPVTGIDPDGLSAAAIGSGWSGAARVAGRAAMRTPIGFGFAAGWALGNGINYAIRNWNKAKGVESAYCPPEVAGPTTSEMARVSKVGKVSKGRSKDRDHETCDFLRQKEEQHCRSQYGFDSSSLDACMTNARDNYLLCRQGRPPKPMWNDHANDGIPPSRVPRQTRWSFPDDD